MKLKSCLNAITAILLIVLITGCERPQHIFDDRLDVLGTSADITLVGLSDSQARDAAQAVEQDLRQLDHVGYTFEAQGELHELNEAITYGASKTVSPELRGLIESARVLYIASGGLLNVATGELIALWEFHSLPPHRG